MTAFLVPFLIGAVCIFLGLENRKGNIGSLHSYHRHRVSEQDRVPFGKLVGLGTILIGCGIIGFSILSAISVLIERDVFTLIGTGIMLISLVAGLGITFHAMIKYNKGIF